MCAFPHLDEVFGGEIEVAGVGPNAFEVCDEAGDVADMWEAGGVKLGVCSRFLLPLLELHFLPKCSTHASLFLESCGE